MKHFNFDRMLTNGIRRLCLAGLYILACKVIFGIAVGNTSNNSEPTTLKNPDGSDVLYNVNDPTENAIAQIFKGAYGSHSTITRKNAYSKMYNLVCKNPTPSVISLALNCFGGLYSTEMSTLNREELTNYIYAVSQIEPSS